MNGFSMLNLLYLFPGAQHQFGVVEIYMILELNFLRKDVKPDYS